jgi:hypothetical protein
MASISASDAEYVDAQMLHVDMLDGHVGIDCESSNFDWLSKFNTGIAYYIDVAVFYTWSGEPANLPSSPSLLIPIVKHFCTLFSKLYIFLIFSLSLSLVLSIF